MTLAWRPRHSPAPTAHSQVHPHYSTIQEHRASSDVGMYAAVDGQEETGSAADEAGGNPT